MSMHFITEPPYTTTLPCDERSYFPHSAFIFILQSKKCIPIWSGPNTSRAAILAEKCLLPFWNTVRQHHSIRHKHGDLEEKQKGICFMQMKIYLIMFVGHDDKQINKSNQEFLHFHVRSSQEKT